MTRGRPWARAAAVACALWATPLSAQPLPPAPAAARLEIALAGTAAGSADLGGGAASLTPNTGGSAYTLFTANAEYRHPLGAELRVAYRLAPWLRLGVTGSLATGDVRVTTGADAEGATPPSFTGEVLGQASVEGRADVLVTRLAAFRGRLVPYLMVSGGWFRQWHQDQVMIETGSVLQAGGGARVRVLRRPRRRLAEVGVALEIRATQSRGGFHWGRERRTVPAARLELFTGWGR